MWVVGGGAMVGRREAPVQIIGELREAGWSWPKGVGWWRGFAGLLG